MLRAKLICPPIRKREILFRIYVAIRVPPSPSPEATAAGESFSGGASYGDEE